MSYRNIVEVLEDIDEGTLVVAMVPSALMDFVDDSNVDRVVESLPREHRAFFLEWAHDVALAPDGERIHLAGVSNLRDIQPEDTLRPRRAIFFASLRSWFSRNPWPEPDR